jgi:hypothetical protein
MTDARHNCARYPRLIRIRIMNGALLDRYLLCSDTLPESKQYHNNNEDSNITAQNKD